MQLFAVGFQFAPDGLVGRADVGFSRIHEMEQHAAALDMPEEAIAKARTFVRAFDQSWNIGEHEIGFACSYHAEIGMQRRKRIISDFWFRGRDGRKKR